MGWWTALKGTMGTRRAERITRAEADQLLAGHSVGTSHAGLAALLSHATAPPRREELIGEAEAVAAFRRLRSVAPSIVDLSTVDMLRPGRRRVTGPLWRGAAVRLAVAALLLAAAGTASITLAYRPVRMQPSPPQVPSSAVPAPNPSPSPSSRARQAPSTPASPSLAPSPASYTSRTGDLAMATELCRAWTAATDKAARDQLAAQLQPLMDRLDGANGVPAFCRKLVGAQPAASATKAGETKASATKATTAKANAVPATPAATKSRTEKKGG